MVIGHALSEFEESLELRSYQIGIRKLGLRSHDVFSEVASQLGCKRRSVSSVRSC